MYLYNVILRHFFYIFSIIDLKNIVNTSFEPRKSDKIVLAIYFYLLIWIYRVFRTINMDYLVLKWKRNLRLWDIAYHTRKQNYGAYKKKRVPYYHLVFWRGFIYECNFLAGFLARPLEPWIKCRNISAHARDWNRNS